MLLACAPHAGIGWTRIDAMGGALYAAQSIGATIRKAARLDDLDEK